MQFCLNKEVFKAKKSHTIPFFSPFLFVDKFSCRYGQQVISQQVIKD